MITVVKNPETAKYQYYINIFKVSLINNQNKKITLAVFKFKI